jgi:hypothetical protein
LTGTPSEVTGLVRAAALGLRGRVEIRGEAVVVTLTDRSSDVYRLDLTSTLEINRLAQALIGTRSLEVAEGIVVDICGSSEIDYERRKAARRTTGRSSGQADQERMLDDLWRYEQQAAARGIDLLTLRRIGEALGLSPEE